MGQREHTRAVKLSKKLLLPLIGKANVIFSKKFVVYVTIIFSEVKRAVIKARRLEQYNFAEYWWGGQQYLIEVRDFLTKGQRYTFHDHTEAKSFEAHIRERVSWVKTIIENGMSRSGFLLFIPPGMRTITRRVRQATVRTTSAYATKATNALFERPVPRL